MGAQSGLASSSCNTDVNNRKVPATLLRDGNTCVIMSKPEGVRCPGLPQGSDQRIHCLAIQHVTSLSGWDSEATALTVPVRDQACAVEAFRCSPCLQARNVSDDVTDNVSYINEP